jgi:GT2 family glycosyltransferase
VDCLPSVIGAVKARGNIDEVVVIDNASIDGSVEYLKKNYSCIKVIEQEKNNFLFSINKEVKKSAKDYFIFLNNDMRVDVDFITPLLDYFCKADVFAVTSRVYDWEGKNIQTGKRFISFKKFTFDSWYDLNIQYPCYTLLAVGGISAYDRKKFIELEGYDELFKPGYLEDVDISYRAWKAGYKIIYCPGSIVYHKGRSTFKKYYTSREIDKIFLRNTLIFTWKNITDMRLTTFYLLSIPYRLLLVILSSPFAISLQFIKTILNFPHIYKKRLLAKMQFKLADKKVFHLINSLQRI